MAYLSLLRRVRPVRWWQSLLAVLVVAACVAGLLGWLSASGSSSHRPRVVVGAYVWGNNTAGVLGTGSSARVTVPSPVTVPKGTVFVSAGGDFALLLTADGKVWAGGANEYGQLGDGSLTPRTKPVLVKFPAGTTVTAVAADVEHSLALTDRGDVYAWGRNQMGQLGDGTTTLRATPVKISLPTPTVAVATGRDHSLALTKSGLYAWGDNRFGQLGDGSTTPRHTPVRVPLPAGVGLAKIDAGGSASLALTTSGRLLAWGDPTVTGSDAPVTTTPRMLDTAPFGHDQIARIGIGDSHAIALSKSGHLYEWGANGSGQLGDGTTTARTGAAKVSLPDGGTASAISTNGDQVLVLASTGDLYAWGDNGFGQLGDGTTNDRHQPQRVASLRGTAVTAVAVGAQQDFALVSSGPPARIALRAVDDSAKAGTSESFAARTVDAFGSDLGETRDVTLTIDDRPCGGDSCRIAAPGPHVVSAVSGQLVGSAVITAQH